MKRVLSLVIVIMMIFGLVPTFADSTATEELADFGIISGDGDGYNEYGVLTRSQFTVLLSQLYGMKDVAAGYIFDTSYTDCVKGEWYYPYVAYVEIQGWMSGMGDGTFAPTEPMTAQQVNAMFVKALGYEVSWDEVNKKAQELDIAVNARNSNQVLRVEAFKALREALDVVPKDYEYPLGVILKLKNYDSDIEIPVEPEDAAIVSIKSTNLMQIEVAYNIALDNAGDESNYFIETTGTAVLDDSSDFELQEDGKTVIITLTEPAEQQEKVKFEVKNMVGLNEKVSLEFLDTKLPKVISVEAVSHDVIRVTFSEPIKTGLTTKANYSADTDSGTSIYIEKVTAGKNNTSALISFYSDLDGDEVLTVEDMRDYQGYKVVPVEEDVVMNIDNDPPEIVSYKNADQNSITLVFDSEIKMVNATLANYYYSTTSNIATDVSIDGNELILEFENEVPSGMTYVYIDKSSIKDNWDNKNSKIAKKVEIVADDQSPSMVGDIKVTGQDTVQVSFDEVITDSGEDFEVVLRDADRDVLKIKTYVTTDKNTLEIEFAEDLLGSYRLELNGVEDKNGNQADEYTLRFEVVDETRPDPDDFTAVIYDDTLQIIRIDFNEEMDPETIGDKAYYFYDDESLDDDEVSIKIKEDNSIVELEVPSDFINMREGHDIFVGRVADASGNLMNGIYGELELLDGDDVKLEIGSVELVNGNTVVLTVENEKLADIDDDKFDFNLDLKIDRIYPGVNDNSESTITFVFDEDVNTGSTLKLTVSSDAGINVYGQTLETGTFTVKDTAPPMVLKYDYISDEKIRLEFNEPLDSDTFSIAGHNGFSVSGGNAELDSVDYSASEVTIIGTGFSKDTNVYYNSMFGITDTDGNPLDDFSKTGTLE